MAAGLEVLDNGIEEGGIGDDARTKDLDGCPLEKTRYQYIYREKGRRIKKKKSKEKQHNCLPTQFPWTMIIQRKLHRL